MKITRRSVLSEALRYRETVMKQASVNGMGLRARAGMQETFDRYQEECRILRELMQALEYEPVRAAIAEFLGEKEEDGDVREWQREIMDGEWPRELFVLKGGAVYTLVPPEE